MSKCLFLLFLTSLFNSFSQNEFHYLVKFKTKHSSYSLSNPELFLSEKSILRRDKYNVELDSTDLPINPSYLYNISSLSLLIEAKSKWLNCIVISSTYKNINDSISKFNFVDTVKLIGEKGLNQSIVSTQNYGFNEEQIESVKINFAHNLGYTGKEVDIAVIDAGFSNVNNNIFFDSLFLQGRIKSEYNFVSNKQLLYNSHNHGSDVLSVIAANIKNEYVGIAPYANYHLLVSEDINQENMIEEYHLIEALEYCDSAGVDIVNISLGYNNFNDERFSHNKEELTGDSTSLSKICNMAWTKGAFVVTSAGNSGGGTWGVVTVPGNSDSIFTVGAVNINNEYASFSSRGNPTINSVLKPNIMGVGQNVKVIKTNETAGYYNGTSFSSPQITGIVACLYEAFPNKMNWEIRRAIEFSASNALNPDSLIGHGLPNFKKAYFYLKNNSFNGNKTNIKIFPNPSFGSLTVINDLVINSIKVFDSRGKIVLSKTANSEIVGLQFSKLGSGIYFIQIKDNLTLETIKFYLQ